MKGSPALQRHQEALAALAGLARQRGQALWLAGGAVRDLVCGRQPMDLDLAVSGDATGLGRALAQTLGTRFIPLKEEFASCRVSLGRGGFLDLTGLRGPDLAGDLARRDFSINAMAVELESWLAGKPEIIDPLGGQKDLAAGLIRPAGPGVLRADPLRVLRALRFMSALDMELAPGTMARLAGAGPGLFRVARERVASEWQKLLAGRRPAKAVRVLDQAMCLTRLVPALAPGRGMAQNPYHHLDVFGHSLACLDALERLYHDPSPHLGPRLADEAAAYLADGQRRWRLMNAALMHDLGKPPTRLAGAPGWASFHRHDIEGANLAFGACRRLGICKADSAWTARMVAGHMRPFHLMGAAQKGGLTKRGVRRLLAFAGEDLAGLLLLAMADTMAGKGPQRPPQAEARLIKLFEEVARLRDQELAAALLAPPLVGGDEVMAATGLGPGPGLGRVLEAVREAQLDGEIGTPGEALSLAGELAAAWGLVDAP